MNGPTTPIVEGLAGNQRRIEMPNKCTRTTAEIAARMEASDDFFGTQKSDLLAWLPFDLARPYLKDGVTEAQWNEADAQPDAPLDKVRDYLPFAWDKANNCRGLSAVRSVEHLKAWLWLAGFDVSEDFERRYQFYGKPCLVAASIIAGFPWESQDDGIWTNGDGDGGLLEGRRDTLISDAAEFAAHLLASQVPGPISNERGDE